MSGDKAAYKAGQAEVQRLMTIVMYQSIIRYAEFMDNDIKSGKNPQATQVQLPAHSKPSCLCHSACICCSRPAQSAYLNKTLLLLLLLLLLCLLLP